MLPVKVEQCTPAKRQRCLNDDLMQCKAEDDNVSSPGGRPATPTHSLESAATAASPEPAATAPGSDKKADTNASNGWRTKLKKGRLVISLSSPSPPVGMTFNRAAAPLKGGHLRPPPPLNVFNTDPPSTPAATAAHPLHQQNVPATKAAQGAEAKRILNAFNARKKDLEANEPEI